jgi:hypothetical protein
MKAYLALPVLAQCDDTATLLSVKAQLQSSLEAGVDHLLDAVGSRNVTQMSGLLQNLVEDTLNVEGPTDLDGDVKAALEVIKTALLGDIRGALNEAHCYDQVELHNTILCFEACENTMRDTPCTEYCDGSAHKDCRERLLGLYKGHITECRGLDDFMKDFEAQCPKAVKKCCLLSHTTWNCGGLCSGAIHGMEVDGYFGVWLQEQVNKFQNAYDEWMKLHARCTASYHAYVEADAKCDCMQAECETTNCEYETCHLLKCEDNYNRCWATCEGSYERTNKAKECLEKDRKIDWSATEKIECYVDVLLAKPTKDQLIAECGTESCHNKWREIQYKHCNDICPEVDFVAQEDKLSHVRRQSDQDVTMEGENDVLTKHRAEDGSDAEVRCTAHLDLDYQVPPCCNPCEARPQPPCTGKGDIGASMDTSSYMWLHYGQFGHLSTSDIADFGADICHSGEHTYRYGYNLCDCLECPAMPYMPPPTCTAAKACCASTGGQYDYRQHDIKVNCAAVSDVEVTPYDTQDVEEE